MALRSTQPLTEMSTRNIPEGKVRLGPVTVAERSKACTVFARTEAAIVSSNPTQGMDV
jgi:hypothetical protein